MKREEYRSQIEKDSKRDKSERERANLDKLRKIIALAKTKSDYYRETLSGVNPEDIQTYADLQKLPVLRKSEIAEIQAERRPLGGLNTIPVNAFRRLFASPGAIYEPEAYRTDYWRFYQAMDAAGVTSSDRILNCFSYHGTPAGFMLESGAEILGCPVFPAGTGGSDHLAEIIRDLELTVYVGTPDFLKVILLAADKLSLSTYSMKIGIFSGGYLSPDLISFYKDRGIKSYQCFGIADAGILAYESVPGRGMVVSENFIVEILHPLTGKQVIGEKGDLAVTALNPEYPLIRYMTGDISMLTGEQSSCGRTADMIVGWMGRSDESVKIKGMFVRPVQVSAVKESFAGIEGINLVVSRENDMDIPTLIVNGEGLSTDAIAEKFLAVTGMKTRIKISALLDEEKLIIDRRKIQ